jgi:hypothetical protein
MVEGLLLQAELDTMVGIAMENEIRKGRRNVAR